MWVVARVAAKFHVLPTVVARDLDDDPELLSLRCLELLDYAEMKNIFDTVKDEDQLKRYRSKLLDRVEANWFALNKERIGKR